MKIKKTQNYTDFIIVWHKAGDREPQRVKKFKSKCSKCDKNMRYCFKCVADSYCYSCARKLVFANGAKISHNNYSYRIRKNINGKYIYVKSTYESFYVDYLRKNNIKFEYEYKRFVFKDGTSYTPDFYLVDTDEYVETKGFLRPRDSEKLKMFSEECSNLKLTVLSRKELRMLGFKEAQYLRKMKKRESTKKCRNE